MNMILKYTGLNLQIVVIFKIPILPNYNTYKKSKW
jgi:hypothetical protein